MEKSFSSIINFRYFKIDEQIKFQFTVICIVLLTVSIVIMKFIAIYTFTIYIINLNFKRSKPEVIIARGNSL